MVGPGSGGEALRASEAQLAAGAELAGLAYYELDYATGMASFDDRFRTLLGFPAEREVGLEPVSFWLEHLHPDDRPAVVDVRERLHDGRLERLSTEYRYLHPAAGQLWIQHLAAVAERGPNGQPTRTFGVLRDISERMRVEDELHAMSQRLIRAQEEERALLARELHDDVTQRLAVLAIDVGRAELAAGDPEQALAMRSLRERLVALSEDLHALAYQLHPSVLAELGLAEALRAECERLARQLRVELRVEPDAAVMPLNLDAALCLFRIAQGALSNVVRHSGARAAQVSVRRVDDGVLLAVLDQGVGFEPASPRQGRSLGLASMRERVRLVNGTLDIETAPGQGTTVVAWVPLDGRWR